MILPTPEHVRKMLASAPLLPPPGGDVVRELALAYLALWDDHEDLKRAYPELCGTTPPATNDEGWHG